MQKRTREIIALVMLVVLLIGTACGVAWYILVGHNWNEAATNIDDRMGSMEGYTAVLYAGTAAASPSSDSKPVSESGASKSSQSSESPLAEIEAGLESLTVDDVAASYREKGAQVIIVHADDLSSYEDPVIIERNGRRIAIVSATEPAPDLAVRKTIKSLGDYAIDFVICVLEKPSSIGTGFNRVNIAITTDIEEADSGSGYVGRTYVVSPFDQNEIGVILIAPSGFLSCKSIANL